MLLFLGGCGELAQSYGRGVQLDHLRFPVAIAKVLFSKLAQTRSGKVITVSCGIQQDFPSARRTLEEAVAASPDEIVLWIVLSHALLQEGNDWSAAEQALRRILELDPENAEAKTNLAKLSRQLAGAC